MHTVPRSPYSAIARYLRDRDMATAVMPPDSWLPARGSAERRGAHGARGAAWAQEAGPHPAKTAGRASPCRARRCSAPPDTELSSRRCGRHSGECRRARRRRGCGGGAGGMWPRGRGLRRSSGTAGPSSTWQKATEIFATVRGRGTRRSPGRQCRDRHLSPRAVRAGGPDAAACALSPSKGSKNAHRKPARRARSVLPAARNPVLRACVQGRRPGAWVWASRHQLEPRGQRTL